ncbi:Uncharacterized protein OBRU01_20220 [Operophtera brumata]|uniref:Uncharacterized protein n=1 Tax=Operophtera brumata TaxID=104452 RepID=A0A0L7KVM0_OPEBR|nr:Uncharacterized protein OBRU01_20220 [Operophtera brumata]
MEAWMKALACASYDYMKLMVAELQRQLDEAQADAAEAAAQVTITPLDGEPKVPPRGQRYNPFNKMNEADTKVQGSRHHKENLRPELPRKQTPFRDIHAAYGRAILADRSAWRARLSKQRDATLIQF